MKKLHEYIYSHSKAERKQIIKYIADALGISTVYVISMSNGIKKIPVKYAVSLEKATFGAVNRVDIFPDLKIL